MGQAEGKQRFPDGMPLGDQPVQELDAIHHVAIAVGNVQEAVDWYTQRFRCRVQYQDSTWAMLVFANIRLALLAEDRHPPHIGVMRPDAAKFGTLQAHRDGTWYVYMDDPAGNAVEILTEKATPETTGGDGLGDVGRG